MIALRMLLRPVTAVGVVTVLAACSGGGAAPTTSGASPAMSSFSRFGDPANCGKDDGVGVKPCKVVLTAKTPTQSVTVTAPTGSTVTVKDKKCVKHDIATIAGAGSVWDVTAGTTSKSCIAMFLAKDANGKNVGKAKLTITNKVQ